MPSGEKGRANRVRLLLVQSHDPGPSKGNRAAVRRCTSDKRCEVVAKLFSRHQLIKRIEQFVIREGEIDSGVAIHSRLPRLLG